MNNDIPRDITGYKNLQIPSVKKEFAKSGESVPVYEEKQVGKDAMECLGAMGCAQVNMRKNDSVRKSIEVFNSDPFAAEMKLEFCDNLIKDKGYDVWQAIDITDKFFAALKEEETYKD